MSDTEQKSQYCSESGCLRKVFLPYVYCDKHQDNSSTPQPTHPVEALPPEGCICASFWTVRQAHKSDCPLAHPVPTPVDGELRKMLFEFEIKAHQTRIDALGENEYENKMHTLLDSTVQLFAAHLQAAVQAAREDEINSIPDQLDNPGDYECYDLSHQFNKCSACYKQMRLLQVKKGGGR